MIVNIMIVKNTDLDFKPFTSTSWHIFKEFLVAFNVHQIKTQFFNPHPNCRNFDYSSLNVSLSYISHIWICHHSGWKTPVSWPFLFIVPFLLSNGGGGCRFCAISSNGSLYFVDFHDVLGLI